MSEKECNHSGQYVGVDPEGYYICLDCKHRLTSSVKKAFLAGVKAADMDRSLDKSDEELFNEWSKQQEAQPPCKKP